MWTVTRFANPICASQQIIPCPPASKRIPAEGLHGRDTLHASQDTNRATGHGARPSKSRLQNIDAGFTNGAL
jgi:hypothetical protein